MADASRLYVGPLISWKHTGKQGSNGWVKLTVEVGGALNHRITDWSNDIVKDCVPGDRVEVVSKFKVTRKDAATYVNHKAVEFRVIESQSTQQQMDNIRNELSMQEITDICMKQIRKKRSVPDAQPPELPMSPAGPSRLITRCTHDVDDE